MPASQPPKVLAILLLPLAILLLPLAAALLISRPATVHGGEDASPAKAPAASPTEKQPAEKQSDAAAKPGKKPGKKADPYAWKKLFDGKTLKGWKVPDYAGKGEVSVKDGVIVMEMGAEMTGIAYAGKVPRENYELEWEAARLDGIDFFASGTFPVGKEYCSFVTGGWGGMVVGISAVNEYYADDNVTTQFHDFKDKQWYKFRVRVTPAKVEIWIDKEQVVDLPRKGHKFSLHYAMELYRPLGISAWVTKGGVRSVRIRQLKPTKPTKPAKPAAE